MQCAFPALHISGRLLYLLFIINPTGERDSAPAVSFALYFSVAKDLAYLLGGNVHLAPLSTRV